MSGVNNSLQNQANKPKFSVALQSDAIQKLINNTLGEQKKAQRFITAISSAVATNQALQECDSFSIINSALLGETLNLSPSPQLGQYYMVPFKQKAKYDKNGQIVSPAKTVATFQLGYKGYIQLAIRSGQYRSINVIDVKEGELLKYDRLSETVELSFIDDEDEREKLPTIGYCAMFELVNGFRKVIYWTHARMLNHADKYSQAFSKDAKGGRYPRVSYDDYKAGKVKESDLWQYSSFWYKDFDGMAFKTMLRQLISKWGIMSIELQTAFENDMTFKDSQDSVPSYVDGEEAPNINPDIVVDEQPQEEAQTAEKKEPLPQEKTVQQDLL